ncbi:NAD(P)/FAD-dependent oxidoreductase [Phyllobacterium chamaecytisi]|uniref:NAD(P)/FAD-dependent oxidoreductase n=1 Tax=Phyllobacterium chamaecytisi TaxID=2876082 RepID=UPI001CCDE282|nr:FAD-dependent oxidoreductase [Phyllobacterium sp. KW56]MBZ9603279.1 FAD-dependent oxidoreductase [Phyllobacterium sp. KW56]
MKSDVGQAEDWPTSTFTLNDAPVEKNLSEHGMVIVGAGHAGARAAEALRKNGWSGKLTIVESEDAMPYERPPLSKAVLSGTNSFEKYPILVDGFFAANGIEHIRDTTALSIDRNSHLIELSNGAELPYHRLLLAPGAEPRRLNVIGSDLGKISFLRSASDANRLASWLQESAKVVIVGGGLIGLEAAASAIARKCDVTVVELANRLMNRAVPEKIALAAKLRHEKEGVCFKLGCAVKEINGVNNVSSLRLSTGEILECDVVLISVGVEPRVSLAQAAGLDIDNGIAVDKYLRTSDVSIYSAGDACSFADEASGERIRLECWKNAEDQAYVVAKNMLGGEQIYSTSPWMWSDQYESTIQIAGFPARGPFITERVCLDGSLLLFHMTETGHIAGVSGFGSLREVGRGVRFGQLMIQRMLTPGVGDLCDYTVDLRSLIVPAVVA